MSGAATLTPPGDVTAAVADVTGVTVVADELDIETRLRTICGHLHALHAQLVDIAAEALKTGC